MTTTTEAAAAAKGAGKQYTENKSKAPQKESEWNERLFRLRKRRKWNALQREKHHFNDYVAQRGKGANNYKARKKNANATLLKIKRQSFLNAVYG